MNKKEFLLISIAIFFTVVSWVVMELYAIQTDDPEGVTLPKVDTRSINTTVIDKLREKTP